MRQPIQPLVLDGWGVLRFRANEVVRWLLDNGDKDMNDLAREDFLEEDLEQFAQLIGYSLSGFSELSYVSDETCEVARKLYEDPQKGHIAARIAWLENELEALRQAMREPIARLYGMHPDDLCEVPA